MIVRTALVVALMAASPVAASADDHCTVPLADWQPQEALRSKLEAAGWSILAIRADDGCYRVVGRDAQGEKVKAHFDPGTLERVPDGRLRRARHHGDGGAPE